MRKLAWALALIWLAGCRPQAAPPPPTPEVVRVRVTPALRAWSERLQGCALSDPTAGLVVDELPAGAPDVAAVAFSLRYGAPADLPAFRAVAGADELVLVVHPANPRAEITLADLRALYAGGVNDWQGLPASAGGEALPVELWSYPTGDDLRETFEKQLGVSGFTAAVHLAPDPGAMLQAVAASPGAIGFLPRSWLDASVRALALNDPPPDGLALTVLALGPSEPEGAARALLGCLSRPPG